MAVDYAKMLHSNEDDAEQHHKLHVFLMEKGEWETVYVETAIIFVVILGVLYLTNFLFHKQYEIQGKLVERIQNRQKSDSPYASQLV